MYTSNVVAYDGCGSRHRRSHALDDYAGPADDVSSFKEFRAPGDLDKMNAELDKSGITIFRSEHLPHEIFLRVRAAALFRISARSRDTIFGPEDRIA